jgi:hypothetical protein
MSAVFGSLAISGFRGVFEADNVVPILHHSRPILVALAVWLAIKKPGQTLLDRVTPLDEVRSSK